MEFNFKFKGVMHIPEAAECKNLIQRSMTEIINTMRDCNNPEVDPTEMSRLLISKTDLIFDLRQIMLYINGEVEAIQEESDQEESKEIYKHSTELIETLQALQMKDELDGEEIKTFCSSMVEVIRNIMDIISLTDKWFIKIALMYVDRVIKGIVDAIKLYRDFGPLDQASLNNLYGGCGNYTMSLTDFCSTRAYCYTDEKCDKMVEASSQLKTAFDGFMAFVSGSSDNKSAVAVYKNYMMDIKEILEDPVQFDTSIDVVQRDDLDNVFNNFNDIMDDPTLTEDEKNAASIALLDGFEGRATANLTSSNPQKARAAVAVVKKVKETKKSGRRGREMLEAARNMAQNMKNICDHLDASDATIQKDMNEVTDQLLGGIAKKVDN